MSMRWVREIGNWLKSLFRSNAISEEINEELEQHIEFLTAEFVAKGMSPEVARKAALKKFGNVESLKEDCRDIRGTRVVMDLIRDIRVTVYSLRKSSGFSLAVIIPLVLCIGANTTVLSALYGIVLKPLPIENPERVVQLFNFSKERNSSGVKNLHSSSSWNQYSDLKKRSDLFEGCALRWRVKKLVSRDASFSMINGQKVTAGFFDLMGAKPLLGRFFLPEEVDPGPGHVVVLTQTAWENEYDSDPNVIGQELLFEESISYTIIGVAPRNMEAFEQQARFFIPWEVDNRDRNFARGRYNAFSNDLWLRLKKDVSREAALEQIREMERDWYEEIANADARRSFKSYDRFEFDLPHPLAGSLYLLEGGSFLILLVGCFNVMTLVLSRVNQKRHELSIRTALGSAKSRLRRLMLVENILLIIVAVGVGMILAWGGTMVINEYLSVLSPATGPIELDLTVFVVTLVLMTGVVIVMSLLPLEILWRAGLLQRVDSSQRTSSAGGFSRKLSNGMIVGQVAIAFVMLIGAGLLFRSFQNVRSVDPGFEANQVVQGQLDYATVKPFYRWRDLPDLRKRILAGMKEIPGVESVSFSMYRMFSADPRREGRNFRIRGEPLDPSHVRNTHTVTPELFTTMGIPILEGRSFNSGDDHNSIIVDELFARRYFKDRSPVGAEVHWNPTSPPPLGQPWQRIVGVAARVNFLGQEQRDGVPFEYQCWPIDAGGWEYTILLRTSRDTEGVIRDMRATLREIDPRLPLSYASSLQESLDEMLLSRKGITLLLLSFAGLALLLSLLGVYAVLAYDVLQRRREIGIRMALGASKQQVYLLILRNGLMKTFIGLGLGIFGSTVLSRFLSSFLFDITSFDLLTYIATVSLFVIAALAACYLPARRAANLDPLKILTVE